MPRPWRLFGVVWVFAVLACVHDRNPPTSPTEARGTGPVTRMSAASTTPAVQITAGDQHSCVLTSGRAYCWGEGTWGEVGDGNFFTRSTPRLVVGGLTFGSLAGGGHHTCGLTVLGQAYCWGGNDFGQVGNGNTSNQPLPVQVPGLPALRSIVAGTGYTCGLAPTGQVYCWGLNAEGQLGSGTFSSSTTPVQVTGGLAFTSLMPTGGSHVCGLTSGGQAHCWGSNMYGALGIGSTANSAAPVQVSGGYTFTSLTGGGGHTCALTTAGKAYCWGRNAQGQLGVGSTTDAYVPAAVQGSHTFTSLVAGGTRTCGLTSTGQAYCWGSNTSGGIGNGSSGSNILTPVPVSQSGLVFQSLAMRGLHTCALTTAGRVYCWGGNVYGQLGNGGSTTAVSLTPAPIAAAAGALVVNVSSSITAVGNTVSAWATVYDTLANVVANPPLTWSSSNPAVATVDASGRVTAVAPGTASIRATSNGLDGAATFKDTSIVKQVVLAPASASPIVGATVQFTVTLYDGLGQVLTGRTITWSSSSPSVASVSASGLVTALTTGLTTITATSEGAQRRATVTVMPAPVVRIEISPASSSVPTGSSRQLIATLYDANNNIVVRPTTWRSSAPNIASVSSSGLVTAGFYLGSATISAVADAAVGNASISTTTPPLIYSSACTSVPVKSGWISVDYSYLFSCGYSTTQQVNSRRMVYYADRPISTTLDVCYSDPVPSGWTRISTSIVTGIHGCGNQLSFSPSRQKIRRDQ
jgi:alpha-tubulin suppressor-like RCC1 family protein/uncharacterized protein YjdB